MSKPNGQKSGSGEELRRVTVRDIAEEVGVHFTTVAEALRDSPRVKEETKRRVREAADRLGYRVDPMLSALSAYRTKQRRPVYQGTLTWINGFDSRDYYMESRGFYQDCFVGAQARSKALGYRLESFWLAEPGMTARRASQILHSRNTAGVIVGPMPYGVDELSLQWDKFCSVRIGYSLRSPELTTLIADQFGNLKMVYERLTNLGFKRIGFVCPQVLDDRVNNHWSGAYFAMKCRHHPDVAIDPFIEVGETPEKFLEWYRASRPEVIIAGGGIHYSERLRSAGVAIPKDVQFVSLHTRAGDSDLAGVAQRGEAVGMVSVDHLVAIIHRFKVGLETHPKTVTIMGDWRDGQSFDASLAPAARA